MDDFIIKSNQIAQYILDENSATFVSFYFSVLGFPYRNNDFEKKMQRKNYSFGSQKIMFTMSCYDGLPYGVLPRKIINTLMTEARKYNTNFVDLGSTSSQIIKTITNYKGGKTSSVFLDQLYRTLTTTFLLEGQDLSDKNKTFRLEPIVLGSSQFTMDNALEKISGGLELSKGFMNLVESSFPISSQLLNKLSAPFHMDVFTFLNYNNYNLAIKGIKAQYPWQLLMELFGDYSDIRYFKDAFKDALKQILSIHPFKLETNKEGILLTGVRDLIFDQKIYTPPPMLVEQESLNDTEHEASNQLDNTESTIQKCETKNDNNLEKLNNLGLGHILDKIGKMPDRNFLRYILEYAEKHSPEYVSTCYEHCVKKNPENFGGYFRNALLGDYHGFNQKKIDQVENDKKNKQKDLETKFKNLKKDNNAYEDFRKEVFNQVNNINSDKVIFNEFKKYINGKTFEERSPYISKGYDINLFLQAYYFQKNTGEFLVLTKEEHLASRLAKIVISSHE